MAQYEVICEGVIRRTILVEAKHRREAKTLAVPKFCDLLGIEDRGVAVVSATREAGHPYQFDLWKEGRNEPR